MSLYNAIANSGQNAGQGVANYFANRYQVQRDQMLDQEAQAQNEFAKQQRMTEEFKYAATLGPQAGMAYLNNISGRYGVPPPGPEIEQMLTQAYQSMGAMGDARPSSVQEWEYYNSLPPPDQARYLDMKRAPATVSLGGGGTGFANPVNPAPTTVVPPEVATGRDAQREGAVTSAREGAQIAATPARTVAQIRAQFDTAAAQSQIEGTQALPQLQAKAQSAISVLSALKSHPGLDYIVGPASVLPIVPGTPQADAFAYIEQIQGQAFLEAFASLRGGGQITQIEGEKATNAIARLNRAQSKQAFTAALDELISIAQGGLDRAQRKAGQDKPVEVQGVQTMPETEQGGGISVDDLVNKYAPRP